MRPQALPTAQLVGRLVCWDTFMNLLVLQTSSSCLSCSRICFCAVRPACLDDGEALPWFWLTKLLASDGKPCNTSARNEQPPAACKGSRSPERWRRVEVPKLKVGGQCLGFENAEGANCPTST